jgi:hypothetical protein
MLIFFKFSVFLIILDYCPLKNSNDFETVFEEIVRFMQNWNDNNSQFNDCHDISSFIAALNSYTATLDENKYLRYSHSQMSDLCKVNSSNYLCDLITF